MPPLSSAPAQIAGTGTTSTGCGLSRSGAIRHRPSQGPAAGNASTPDLLDLPVHRLHDRLLLRRSLRLAQGVDPGSLLASELAKPCGFWRRYFKVAASELADPAFVLLLVAGQYSERQVLVAGPLERSGGDDAHAVGVEQHQGQPLCGKLRLHLGLKPPLPAGIPGLCGNQDRRESLVGQVIQLFHQLEQDIHPVVLREPRTGRRRRGRLLRRPGTEGSGPLHAPVYHPDPLQSLESG